MLFFDRLNPPISVTSQEIIISGLFKNIVCLPVCSALHITLWVRPLSSAKPRLFVDGIIDMDAPSRSSTPGLFTPKAGRLGTCWRVDVGLHICIAETQRDVSAKAERYLWYMLQGTTLLLQRQSRKERHCSPRVRDNETNGCNCEKGREGDGITQVCQQIRACSRSVGRADPAVHPRPTSALMRCRRDLTVAPKSFSASVCFRRVKFNCFFSTCLAFPTHAAPFKFALLSRLFISSSPSLAIQRTTSAPSSATLEKPASGTTRAEETRREENTDFFSQVKLPNRLQRCVLPQQSSTACLSDTNKTSLGPCVAAYTRRSSLLHPPTKNTLFSVTRLAASGGKRASNTFFLPSALCPLPPLAFLTSFFHFYHPSFFPLHRASRLHVLRAVGPRS